MAQHWNFQGTLKTNLCSKGVKRSTKIVFHRSYARTVGPQKSITFKALWIYFIDLIFFFRPLLMISLTILEGFLCKKNSKTAD